MIEFLETMCLAFEVVGAILLLLLMFASVAAGLLLFVGQCIVSLSCSPHPTRAVRRG